MLIRRVQKRIELALAFERVEIVAAADMLVADEDLRHRACAVGLVFHFLAGVGIHEHVDFVERRALLLQKRLGAHADRGKSAWCRS